MKSRIRSEGSSGPTTDTPDVEELLHVETEVAEEQSERFDEILASHL